MANCTTTNIPTATTILVADMKQTLSTELENKIKQLTDLNDEIKEQKIAYTKLHSMISSLQIKKQILTKEIATCRNRMNLTLCNTIPNDLKHLLQDINIQDIFEITTNGRCYQVISDQCRHDICFKFNNGTKKDKCWTMATIQKIEAFFNIVLLPLGH